MPEAIVVLCTVPADFDAERLARELVERSLAACVQIGPGVTSVYRWQGALEKSAEKILLIKSRTGLFGALEAAIKARHPYQVPEIIALPVSDGHAPYLEWLAASTAG
ncbi:MAG TPA: divalent-cation tolerance protein CutA [Vicinamibacteria bacterium]|nr:divalent-cation tolerance protein CutA [Vicinamibacteria bacterium]